jgi:hypothetical protein
MVNRLRRVVSAGTALAVSALVVTALSATPADADTSATPLSGLTVTGVHNTYNNPSYPYLAQALDAGTGMVELDGWTDVLTNEWKVSHDSPTSNKNNCVDASSASQLYSGGANKDLGSCLDDIKHWLAAHPTAGPIYVKIEM